MLNPAIHLEGWGKHFEHEYIIKPSKNLMNDPSALWKDLVPYQFNLMQNFNEGLASFRQTLALSRQKFGQI